MTAFLVVHVVVWVVAAGGFVLATADEPGVTKPLWLGALAALLAMASWSTYLLLSR